MWYVESKLSVLQSGRVNQAIALYTAHDKTPKCFRQGSRLRHFLLAQTQHKTYIESQNVFKCDIPSRCHVYSQGGLIKP